METEIDLNKDEFISEYKNILDENTDLSDTEWKEKGDFFKKFSMYDNYTPVKTSVNTTLISK